MAGNVTFEGFKRVNGMAFQDKKGTAKKPNDPSAAGGVVLACDLLPEYPSVFVEGI